jgi:dTDP-4-dehydrorhamnose reductase
MLDSDLLVAAEAGARTMYISTDDVFDGNRGRDCVESDPVAPINVYGQTKAVGEQPTIAAGQCSWFDFAREIFARSELEVTTLPATSDTLGRRASRPAWPALAAENPHVTELPGWQDGPGENLAYRGLTRTGNPT